jgi:hypothetical protein
LSLPFHCILSPAAPPIPGANRSNLSATGSRRHNEQAYSQVVLKPRENATKKTGACDVESRRPKKQVQLRAIAAPKNGKGCDIGYAPAVCSLRESLQRGHARSQPLMRSPLSQFQTPTAPRRNSRFFRVWLLFRLPCRADHSAYFGLARSISPILSAVDASQTK